MSDRQLMQRALDALQGLADYRYTKSVETTMKALNERLAQCDRCGKRLGGEGDIHTCTPDPIGDAQSALIAEMAAQPEQEPVHQWREKHSAYWYDGYPDNDDGGGPYETRTLYATPPAAPMTEFEEAVAACDNTLHHAIDHWQDRALKAEAKLAQPEQEPVAWMFQHGETGRMSFVSNDGMNNPELFLAMNPRYALVCALVTAPAAQRKPLTDEEMWRLWNAEGNDAMNQQEAITFARAIEAAHGIK
jgi:hypothetical protein